MDPGTFNPSFIKSGPILMNRWSVGELIGSYESFRKEEGKKCNNFQRIRGALGAIGRVELCRWIESQSPRGTY